MEPVHAVSVGPYELVRPIGEGGMAQVYLCLRRGAGGFEKRVVLKVLHSNFVGNDEYVAMFLDEARLLARMQHPNVVHVFEVECVGGIPYLAMEFVNGPTLGRLFKAARQTGLYDPGYLLHILHQTCLGLHHAHTLKIDGVTAGLVHRDVSSQNILVDAETGVAKLIDFGIAKVHESPERTRVGVLKGKLNYMAPEVLRGVRADARADLYAVGVLLYRLVTDRLPYPENEDFSARIAGRYPPPSEVADNVSPQIEAIIARALEPDPDARWQTAAELAAALLEEVTRLRTDIEAMPRWIKRIFPGGEGDWTSRHDPTQRPAAGDHSSLSVLVSDGASIRTPVSSRTPHTGPTPAPVSNRAALPLRLAAMVAAAGALFVFTGICLGGAVGLGITTLTPGPRTEDAAAYVQAADELLEEGRFGPARDMNARAGSLGVDDPALVIRITTQKWEIERQEVLFRARAAMDEGDLERARMLVAPAVQRQPSDTELSSLLLDIDARMGAGAGLAPRPRPQPGPTPERAARDAGVAPGPAPSPEATETEPAAPTPQPAPDPEPGVAEEAVPAPTPVPPAAATTLEDLDVETASSRVVVRGRLAGAPLEPVGYYLEEDETHASYVIRLKGAASAIGADRLQVFSPLVTAVTVSARGSDLIVTVDCDAQKVAQPSFQPSSGGFVLTVAGR